LGAHRRDRWRDRNRCVGHLSGGADSREYESSPQPSHYNALSLAQRPFEMAIADQGLADLIEMSYASPERLSEGQWFRCGNYLFMQFNSWEYLYYQNRDGSIPNQLWVGADTYFKQLIETKPGLRRFWSEYQHAFDDPFRSYVANEFAKKTATATPPSETPTPTKN
jgi:hypothetical protein